MIIRLTSKLAKKLKIPLSSTNSEKEPSINEWYSNLFTFQRNQYILLTNEKSLFSMVFYGKGVSNDNIFIKKISEQLKEMLEDYELGSVWEEYFMFGFGRVNFSKTLNRAVLGTMNEIIYHAKIELEIDDISSYDLSFKLNTSIYSLIKYKKPIEAFREYFKKVIKNLKIKEMSDVLSNDSTLPTLKTQVKISLATGKRYKLKRQFYSSL